MRFFILLSLVFAAGCSTVPTAPVCKHPENVYTPSTPEKKASYVNAAGETRYCTKGHCKGATYNACSESAELCCTKN